MSDSMRTAIAAGDVRRGHWPVRMQDHLNLYLGSGRAGACFDAWGLMQGGIRGWPGEGQSQSRTTLMHADHWHRGLHGLDYWLPVARLLWAGAEPPPPTRYRQELSLYDGRLETELVWPSLKLILRAWFNPERRDLLAVEVQYQAGAGGAMPSLLLAPEVDLHTHYGQHLTGKFAVVTNEPAWWAAQVRVGTAASLLAVRILSSDGQVKLESGNRGPTLAFAGPRGRHLLVIGSAGLARGAELSAEMQALPPAEQYAAEAIQAWHRRWGDAFVQVPVAEYQALWARSLYYTLCSYAPDVRSPAAPMGWTGNGWPFHFPQDVSYIHPALLRLGHLDIAKAWIEFYRGYLAETVAVTKRLYRADGAMWAWEHPIGPDTQMLADGTPNWFQFEIHNAAYPLRMAYETALYLHDPKWTREVAWPVVLESARFYGSTLRRESDGTWGLHVIPSMGQDEHGGQDAKNYLCALYSARYSLTVATRMARELNLETDELARWRGILAEGLAFGHLLLPQEGYCATCEGLVGREMLGRQKHPVQLNPLNFLPLDRPEEQVLRAYARRYDICIEPGGNFFAGWTLAAYWLAAAHVGDAAGLLKGLGQALPARYVDPDWLQIYESSGALSAPYYVTSHGLYLQALNDALVNSYWEGSQVGGACPETWQEVSFANLRVPKGRLSGRRDGRRWQVQEGA